ncbi:hypothetical protein CJ026_026705, partial [Ralstonia pickettii]|uniref:hypothetical protein n=1 Tax=Ralstonia pickettii TaxID=329 RepID=UPI000D2A6E20
FANPVATLGIMLVASLTYAAIVLALNVWLGSVGQFLGLVLMVLQLVTAGGTFPWQTLPGPVSQGGGRRHPTWRPLSRRHRRRPSGPRTAPPTRRPCR